MAVCVGSARTFMRLQLPGIKLLCVDEPSSALDPLGEFELFKHLKEYGRGTTKIFVTHRFGHLTKHADVIMWVIWCPRTSPGIAC